MRRTAPPLLVMVMTSFDPGGTERQMVELVRRLDRQRWAVQVAGFRARGAWFDRVAASAPVTIFPVTTFQRPAAIRQLWAFAGWCRAQQAAIVHTAELPANIFGLPGAALAGVPVRIGNRREINPDKTPVAIVAQRAAYSCAHRIVANSRAAATRLLAERVPERKVAVIPNGLDVDAYRPQTTDRIRRRVVVVANLRREKGHDVLIDAAPDVLRSFPDARFEVVGAGPEMNALVQRARERAVAHAFTFAGHRDDIPERLAASDIFALPSRSEAFPNSVLEAMAMGLPVVASKVGGIPEIIDDGRTGLLVPVDHPSALADRLCQVMANSALGARLGGAARGEVERRYSFDRMVGAFELLYANELTRRGIVGAGHVELAAS